MLHAGNINFSFEQNLANSTSFLMAAVGLDFLLEGWKPECLNLFYFFLFFLNQRINEEIGYVLVLS